MKTKCRRNAFTLIEVLIVVVIMAVLAATIIPQFSSSTEDAKESAANYNLHAMQAAIELYKVHHMGNFPDLAVSVSGQWLPQLTLETDVNGTYNETGTSDPATYPYGPYFDEVPANPFNDKSDVADATGTVENLNVGWQYDTVTGRIYSSVFFGE